MKILYIHGFASKFDVANEKVVGLKSLGEVVGITVDYTRPWIDVFNLLASTAMHERVDLIVGTSLGGYWAAEIGEHFGIPFVALNPSIEPSVTLKRYEGKNVSYTGDEYELSSSVIDSYANRDFAVSGSGLVILDAADEVLDSDRTKRLLEPHYAVSVFDGGSHRFEHINESLELIEKHVLNSELVYGS
jgi:hypothetical protein